MRKIVIIEFSGLALKESGHDVHFLTSYHDPSRCFKETVDGSLNVSVAGSWFPRTIFGRFYAMCAYIRMIIGALHLIFWEPVDSDLFDFDIIFCDQISAPIPLFKWFSHVRNGRTPKVIFYCHFPDLLLTERKNLFKRIYRLPIDWMEEKTTGSADVILVNSKFTEGVFRETFPSLSHMPLYIVYPTCNFALFDKPTSARVNLKLEGDIAAIFLSINRYERKKKLTLAIESLARLKQMMTKSGSRRRVHLIIAGGYDDRLPENREYFEELNQLTSRLEVEEMVTFLKTPSDGEKQFLLQNCTAVLYTPENEHFGIVPLESMYMSRPVIACRSGGPMETVIHDETGFLCEPDVYSFSEAMMRFVQDRSLAREMGSTGRRHVIQKFSYTAFRNNLQNVIMNHVKTS